MNESDVGRTPMTSADDVIVADGIEVRFPGCDALRGLDLVVKPGSVFALLGENGAGKTTLIRILTGFQKPSAGSCRVLGLDPKQNANEIRRRIGYVSDSPTMYDWMKVDEIGWFTAGFYPDGFLGSYRSLISKFELPPLRRIRELSKGQRAKVALSLALAHNPDLLILDEPTSGLDPLVRREFLESMVDRAATGQTVFLSSHQISEIELVADTIAIIHQGRVRLTGNLQELKNSISEVTVKVNDPLVSLPTMEPPAEVLSEHTKGRQRRLIVRNYDPAYETQIADSFGVIEISHRPASLEEMFIACTRGIMSDNAVAREPAR